ncbi:hypothetical protein ACJIZ3_000751 [Penstemon smallii]|uniref:RRM domain-containing protein n=1 Tax=Penstemon smallii TaxID=265156 RepID=A0ABD3U572_9LAMI
MDFDEYEYLENTVENPELKKLEDKVNGGDGVDESEKDRSRRSKHKSDDYHDDLDRPSKRSRSEKESHDHDKDRRSRHGSSSRDRERGEKDKYRSTREHRNRDKEEINVKEKDRDRDRDRVRNGGKDRERDNDKKKDGDKEMIDSEYARERKWEGDGERSRRSRSHSERHHDARGRERSRDVENIDKDFKERRRERESRDRDQESRRYREKKEEAVEAPADPERDQRTVFAYQITLKATERDVYEFFSRAGKVRDVRLITDRNTGRSKGVGYVEFVDVMSVPMAIALSGQPILGQPMMVKPSEAEKNLVQPTPAGSGAGGLLGTHSGGARRLYVGNLPLTIKEDQLRQVFEPFGTVELVQMPMDPGTGNCKGYAFLQFARLEDAKLAQNLNGQLEIAGRLIKVSAITDQAGMQEAGANIADLDDDEGGGLSLNAHSRALLMQKLDRTGTSSSINGSFGTPTVDSLAQTSVPVLPGLAAASLSVPSGPSIDTIGVPSECLLLKNMFDPNSEGEPDFDLDIKEDVQDECSKYGKLKHIYVEKNSAGYVYLRFENAQSAMAAQRALHGRWFAGKMITATFILPLDYEARFRTSA